MTLSIKRIELYFWALTPALITLLFFILCLIRTHMPGFSEFMPILPLIPIFYWGLLHAKEMPFWFVCMVGILMDAGSGLPLGISAMLYVFFLAIIQAQRKYIYKESFFIIWCAFTALLAGLCMLQWIVLSISAGRIHEIFPPLLQWLFTVGCYPLLHKTFDKLMQHIQMRRWKLIHA